MPITRNDIDQVSDRNGNLLSSTPVVRDVTVETNEATVRQQAVTAFTNNRTYLAVASPNNAQVVAQVRALTKQINGLMRLNVRSLLTDETVD